MKFLLILFLFKFSFANAGSFSEMFGSEGAAGISNSKSRSLSYSIQYLAFSGVTGYGIKELYDTGFFEPVGLIPDYYKSLSPLVYDKSEIFPQTEYNLRKSKDIINVLNDISFQKNKRLSSFNSDKTINVENKFKKIKTNLPKNLKSMNNENDSLINSQIFKNINNQKKIYLTDFQINNKRIQNLINRYE